MRAAETYYAIAVFSAPSVNDSERHKGVPPGSIQMEGNLIVMLAGLFEIDLFRGVDESRHLVVRDEELSLPEYRMYLEIARKPGNFPVLAERSVEGKGVVDFESGQFPFFCITSTLPLAEAASLTVAVLPLSSIGAHEPATRPKITTKAKFSSSCIDTPHPREPSNN